METLYPLMDAQVMETYAIVNAKGNANSAVANSGFSLMDGLNAAKEAFARYDLDESGSIDRNELLLLLADMGASDVDEAALQRFDTNSNGEFSFDEFVGLHNFLQGADPSRKILHQMEL